MVSVSAVGSWPGRDVGEALRTIRGELADLAGSEVTGIPYLPVLADRGAASGLAARTAGLLVDLSVDLQPQGWRLVDRPGRDLTRISSARGEDLDLLAEVFHGWTGPFVVQALGPWSLAAQLWLPRGDRVLGDPGAARDLFTSQREGLLEHLAQVQRLLPGAQVTAVLHEPDLPAVLRGSIRSDSGLRALPIPDRGEVRSALRDIVDAIHAAGHRVGLRTAASAASLKVIAPTGFEVLSLDLTRLDDAGWEVVAPLVEAGRELWAGLLPPADAHQPRHPAATAVDHLQAAWQRIGLEPRRLSTVTLTPVSGLGELTPEQARRTLVSATDAARMLTERLAS